MKENDRPLCADIKIMTGERQAVMAFDADPFHALRLQPRLALLHQLLIFVQLDQPLGGGHALFLLPGRLPAHHGKFEEIVRCIDDESDQNDQRDQPVSHNRSPLSLQNRSRSRARQSAACEIQRFRFPANYSCG